MSTGLSRGNRSRSNLPSVFSGDPFNALRSEFHNMLSTWLFDNAPTIPAGFSPSLDLHETDTDYEINADLPGLQANDIQVQLSENVLTISGERKYEKTDDKDKNKEGKKAGTRHFVTLLRKFFSLNHAAWPGQAGCH